MRATFETMLKGGHDGVLGRTINVVRMVLAEPGRLGDLLGCDASADPVVRLRTSNAPKRVAAERRDLLLPFIGRLITEVGPLDQAAARWTLAQLSDRRAPDMDARQRAAATHLMARNLEASDDWIVLNARMDTLSAWSASDADLATWLRPHPARLARGRRKSVASRAGRHLSAMDTCNEGP